jgi:hypothetical protein
MKKICPRCTNYFDCKHNDILQCHCVSIRLDSRQLEFIGRNYDGCLCHSCLQEIKDYFPTVDIIPFFHTNTHDAATVK